MVQNVSVVRNYGLDGLHVPLLYLDSACPPAENKKEEEKKRKSHGWMIAHEQQPSVTSAFCSSADDRQTEAAGWWDCKARKRESSRSIGVILNMTVRVSKGRYVLLQPG